VACAAALQAGMAERNADVPVPRRITLRIGVNLGDVIIEGDDRRTGNLRAVQLLLGHTKIESTVRYLGIEVDDALAIAEQVDV
jgi:hypothetical protein